MVDVVAAKCFTDEVREINLLSWKYDSRCSGGCKLMIDLPAWKLIGVGYYLIDRTVGES